MECIFECKAGLHVVAIVASPLRTTQCTNSRTYRILNCDAVAWEEVKRNGYSVKGISSHPCFVARDAIVKKKHKITWRESTQDKQKRQVAQMITYATDLAKQQWHIDRSALNVSSHALNLTLQSLSHEPKPRIRLNALEVL